MRIKLKMAILNLKYRDFWRELNCIGSRVKFTRFGVNLRPNLNDISKTYEKFTLKLKTQKFSSHVRHTPKGCDVN